MTRTQADEYAPVASVLGTVAQPVWVVDHDGLIRFANPAAVAALGYDSLAELVGKPSHETIHYKHADGSPFPVEECPMLGVRASGRSLHLEDWFVRSDGSMLPVEYWSAPFETAAGRGAVVAFTDLSERRQIEQVLRERDTILESLAQPVYVADHEGLIRYANPAAVAALGFDDVSELIGNNGHWLVHYKRPDGSPLPIEECQFTRARGLGEPIQEGEDWFVRKDGSMVPLSYTAAPIETPYGFGTVIAFTDVRERREAERAARERDVAEARAAELEKNEARRREILEELVATREREKLVADEQAALRRVATLVARGAAQRDVFDAVCEETGRLIGATNVNLAHFTPDHMNVTVAGWSLRSNHVPPGTRLPLRGGSINALVKRSEAPARVDSYEGAPGELAALLRRLGIVSEVAAPVAVDGRVWGALIVGSDTTEPFPEETEARLARFAELIGAAVSNATARSDLIAARRRVIEAADSARARVTRDLHDGAQQQFVNTVLNLQLAQEKWASAPERANELVELAIGEARAGIDGLRELAAGIHPAILTTRGLSAALDGLAARLPMEVDLDVLDERLPESVEASVYFFCSEALANIVKHAHASAAHVRIAREGADLAAEVRDDGIGGAAPRQGSSGLLGLQDRIAALDGKLDITSPPGEGTALSARVPLPVESPARQAPARA